MFLLRENSLTQYLLSPSSAPLILPLQHLFFPCTTYSSPAPLILPLRHLFFPCTTYPFPASLILVPCNTYSSPAPLILSHAPVAFPCTTYTFPCTNIRISWKCLYLRINKTAKTYIFFMNEYTYIYNYNKNDKNIFFVSRVSTECTSFVFWGCP